MNMNDLSTIVIPVKRSRIFLGVLRISRRLGMLLLLIRVVLIGRLGLPRNLGAKLCSLSGMGNSLRSGIGF